MEYDHTKDVVKFALLETLAFLRAIHWSHWTAHWQVNYYGDHLLFEELYNNTQKEIDSLGEKCVSFFGTESVNDRDQAKKMIEILSWIEEEDYLKRGMAFEDKFIGYLVATWELVNGANKMTMGLDNLLQQISETHEKHLYLLRQRTKTNKVGSKMNLNQKVATEYLKKKAVRGGVYIPTKDLPPFIKKVLKEHRFQRRDIEVRATDRVDSFGFATFEGNRPFAIAIDLSTGQTKSVIGDYSGVTPELKGTLTLRENMAIVTGEHGGRGSFARLFLHPTNMATLLPSNDTELSENEKYALKYISIYNSSGRKQAFREKGFGTYSAQHPLVKSLAEKGLLKISGRAVRITTDGRNVAQGLNYKYESYSNFKYSSIINRVANRYLKVAKSPRKKWENPNNGRSKVIYTEAILDNPKKLLSWWENNVGELLSDTSKTAHHMTIEYGGNNPGIPLSEVEQIGVGSPVRLEIIGYAQSDRVQAVLVKPQGIKSSNKYPHITVAVGNGGNPTESNDLLARGYERVKGETLTAKIGYFGRGKHLTQIDWENE